MRSAFVHLWGREELARRNFRRSQWMWSYKFSMIFMLVNFSAVLHFAKYDLHKVLALQLLTRHRFRRNVCALTLRCSWLVCAIYRKRQQYRVDLIAKIIFIYGFPFQPSYTHSLTLAHSATARSLGRRRSSTSFGFLFVRI